MKVRVGVAAGVAVRVVNSEGGRVAVRVALRAAVGVVLRVTVRVKVVVRMRVAVGMVALGSVIMLSHPSPPLYSLTCPLGRVPGLLGNLHQLGPQNVRTRTHATRLRATQGNNGTEI